VTSLAGRSPGRFQWRTAALGIGLTPAVAATVGAAAAAVREDILGPAADLSNGESIASST
jgi:hypothetical protein